MKPLKYSPHHYDCVQIFRAGGTQHTTFRVFARHDPKSFGATPPDGVHRGGGEFLAIFDSAEQAWDTAQVVQNQIRAVRRLMSLDVGLLDTQWRAT